MVTYAPAPSTFNPAIPQNFANLGISESLVLDLVLRRLMIEGYSTLAGLSRSLRIAVPLNDYHAAIKAQGAKVNVDRQVLRDAFSDLIVTDRMLDQLGPAIISQTSIFVYGPTGNGKTSLAERMLRVYKDTVMIPYAVEVDNQIISLYDPVVHHPLEHDQADIDPRWLVCKRPCILVGGELIPSML